MKQYQQELNDIKCYENYPWWITTISNIFQLSIYGIGAYIIYRTGLIPLFVYIGFILLLEYRLLKKSCIHCYYYGKNCFSGKGKIASLIFKKGEPATFINKPIRFLDILPDFLVSLVPIATGIVLIIFQFEWHLITLIAILVLLTFSGNALIRSSLACKYCKQRLIGCPAEQLFRKSNNKHQI